MQDKIQLLPGETAVRIIGESTNTCLMTCYPVNTYITYDGAEKYSAWLKYEIPSLIDACSLYEFGRLRNDQLYWIKPVDNGLFSAINGADGKFVSLGSEDRANTIFVRRIPIVEAD